MSQQTTLLNAVRYADIGLHSGAPVELALKPAPAGTGIRFVRTDLPGLPSVQAAADRVTSVMRATTLENGAARVFTVEHLMAALYALQVDNCIVELSAAEAPVGDGSAAPFVALVEQAGICKLAAPRKPFVVSEPITVADQQRSIQVLPYNGLKISFTSFNPHPLLGEQFAEFEITPAIFASEIAPARTVGFLHEVEALQAKGLALGGNLHNTLVYDAQTSLNPARFTDELVRHKILDVIGDLALLGRPLCGHIVAVQSGHAMNTELAKKLWDIVQNDEKGEGIIDGCN